MSRKRSLKAVYEEVKERKIKHESRFSTDHIKLDDTASENDLVIDDDYDAAASSTRKKSASQSKVVKVADEPFNVTCAWIKCEESFQDLRKFRLHVDEHTLSSEESQDGALHCGFRSCLFSTSFMDSFMRHTDFHCYHEKLKNYGQNYLERNTLPKCKQTMYQIPEMDDYTCEWSQCNSSFSSIFDFFSHVRFHCYAASSSCEKGESFQCEWIGCTHKSTMTRKLIEHTKSHTKEKAVACPTCGSMYGSRTRFYDHRQRQIPLELSSFQCSECSKLFSTERILRDHMRSHVNCYKCNFCDMTCPKPAVLAKHIRFRHVNARPFKCTICDHSSISKYHLEMHLTTHCAEKLFACDKCDHRCRSGYGLERHQQKVHGKGFVSNYECHVCQDRFPRGGTLTQHLMKEHDFKWPSGHSRFRYKRDADGMLRLQTVRYESLEVTQQMMEAKTETINEAKYKIVLNSKKERIPAYEIKEVSDSDELSDDTEEEKDEN